MADYDGNPYKKIVGGKHLFAGPNDYDYMTNSVKRIDNDHKIKDQQINKNSEDAIIAKKQNDIVYAPADKRGKGIGTRLSKEHKDYTQDYYDEANNKKNEYKKDIDKLNLNDEKAVVDKAREILSNHPGMVCYGTAAGVAMILDERGIEYTIHEGYAETSKTKVRVRSTEEGQSQKSNHVWVETKNGKIYSWFDGDYSNTTRFFNITDDINLKKRGK